MSDAPVFGRVEDPAQLDLTPFSFTLVGYKPGKRNGPPVEAPFEFTCSGVQPFGAWLDMLHHTSASGSMPVPAIVNYVERCLIDDDERARWRETLETPDVSFDGQTLGAILDWMVGRYAERPTLPPTGSDGGQQLTSRRSAAAAGAKAGARSRNGQPA